MLAGAQSAVIWSILMAFEARLLAKLATALVLFSLAGCSSMPKPSEQVITQLAPQRVLRAAINFGNPILASKDPGTAEPSGVSVDLARALAERLGVQLRLVPFESAGSVVKAVHHDEWDVAFVAVDPVRGEDLLQTAPYVMIEGAYLVRDDSLLRDNDDVDRPGTTVVVASGSAYDLYLTRTLKQATIVRTQTSPEVTDYFVTHQQDVAAGVKQQLMKDALRIKGLRLLPGRFMRIDQAMATPKGRTAALAYLQQFVAEMKSTGFIERSLKAHHIEGAEVAP
jgi:polar amino acid transport system substrate-binding protein